MALPIITADQRLAEPRGIKGTIFGKRSGDGWEQFANLRDYYAMMWG